MVNEKVLEDMNGGLKMSIKFEDVVLPSAEQWRAIIMGARNPMNSWEKSNSNYGNLYDECEKTQGCDSCPSCYEIGSNDLDLMKRLRNSGTDHRKFMRMIPVIVTITAPLYWWKEFDTYKVGTVANSCSTMHKIADKEFTLEDFSTEHLADCESVSDDEYMLNDPFWNGYRGTPMDMLIFTIKMLNHWRNIYLESKSKRAWWQMIQLLPSSYNQKRTVMMNYEVLANIYKSRRNHKLDEWAETRLEGNYPADMYPNKFTIGFCDWIKTLPYSELITGDFKEEEK